MVNLLTIPYVVQKGDTYLRICLRYGIHIQALMSYNPHLALNEYAIPGQLIHIPPVGLNIYVIQPEDTFFSIASKFQVPAQWLANANPSVNPRALSPGQSMMIPYWCDERDPRRKAEYGPVQLRADIDRLALRYPFLRVEQIGESVLGHPIWAIGIGNGSVNIHANGAVHANEWLTSAALMEFIEDYAAHYATSFSWNGWNVHTAYERSTLWVVPMVNPDGVELVQEGTAARPLLRDQLLEWNLHHSCFSRWKANIRGVDLNDQFPAHWHEERERRGVAMPAPMNYGGKAPLTEPEAIALVEHVSCKHIDIALSFHSQGQEIYWNYRDYEPAESESWAKQLGRASGYKAVKLSGSDAGFKDWFIQQYRKPGFTVEVGYGVNPLPLSQLNTICMDVNHIMQSALGGLKHS